MSKRGNRQGSIYKRPGREPWYIAWYDHESKRRVECSGATKKASAERLLADRLNDVMLRITGIIDPRQEKIAKEAKRPISEHLKGFEAMMQARRRNPKHVGDTLGLIRQVCCQADFMTIGDISADGVNLILAGLKRDGYAARTMQKRAVALKSFTKWLADHGKLPADPLRTVERPKVKEDRRNCRRMLLPDEWPHLLAATLAADDANSLTPQARALLYELDIQTGLRAAEIQALTKADLFLSGQKPYVLAKAITAKNRRTTKQYISVGLAARLQELVAAKTPAALVFPVSDRYRMAAMLRRDLGRARSAWIKAAPPVERERREQSDFLKTRNHQGDGLDFHALRHTCGAWLAIEGEHPNVIKDIMRHSTITLTMDTYGHLLPNATENASRVMGRLFGRGTMRKEKYA